MRDRQEELSRHVTLVDARSGDMRIGAGSLSDVSTGRALKRGSKGFQFEFERKKQMADADRQA